MNSEELIKDINNNISTYKNFTSPDYPDLNVFSNQYLDILVKFFNNAQIPYSVIFSDVNKLSVVNERYGKITGDKTLYLLLRLFLNNPFFKNCSTIRIGGDEFVTFVPNSNKQEVEKALKIVGINIDRQKEYLYGSSMAFGVEDSNARKCRRIN